MSVMTARILPEVALEEAPFWRQCLRGFSQCAFQCNEITGLAFILAVAVHNWRMAIFYVIGVILGTLVARLLGGDRTLLGLGLFGFNSGLMGLALGNFFVSIFKDSALVSVITMRDLMFSGQILAAATFKHFEIFAEVAVIYFIISYPSAKLVEYIEQRLDISRAKHVEAQGH